MHKLTCIKKQQLKTLSFFGMRQYEQESIHAYIHMFNTRVVEVLSVDSDILISTSIQGLIPRDLFKSLVKNPPTSIEGLLAKEKKNINIEEAHIAQVEEPKRVPK